jgi:hypothetical protein
MFSKVRVLLGKMAFTYHDKDNSNKFKSMKPFAEPQPTWMVRLLGDVSKVTPVPISPPDPPVTVPASFAASRPGRRTHEIKLDDGGPGWNRSQADEQRTHNEFHTVSFDGSLLMEAA